ncbi:MAG: response regulator transcription factor [Geminicoccaceae bacterium]
MAKVLVIEDEQDLREIIVAELEDLGHRTIQAVDGEQGLQKTLNDNPDIIVADINMPKMSGHQLRGHLQKNHPEHAKIPFMFLSALADPADIADGMMVGVDHYLTKPVNFDMLQGWINDLTRGR